MGSVQQIRVKWNNHLTNFPKVFDNLLHKKDFVDVTLSCEGHSMKAHKLVLSACSPYFHNLFVENPCKHPIVIMRDFKYSEIEAVIEYMYKGEVNIAREGLREFLKTAQSLQVKGLADDNCDTNEEVNENENNRTYQNKDSKLASSDSTEEYNSQKRPETQSEHSGSIHSRDMFNLPTPSKRMRTEKSQASGNTTDSLPLLTPKPVSERESPMHRVIDVNEPSIKLEVKEDHDFQYEGTQDSMLDEAQEGEEESPDPDTIILGDDHELMEEEPDIMFAHNNSQDSNLSEDHTSNLLSALGEAGTSSSMSLSQPSPSEGTVFRRRPGNKRTSKVWLYFNELPSDPSHACCSLCGTVVSRGGTKSRKHNTANLMQHIRHKHKQQYEEFNIAPSEKQQNIEFMPLLGKDVTFTNQ